MKKIWNTAGICSLMILLLAAGMSDANAVSFDVILALLSLGGILMLISFAGTFFLKKSCKKRVRFSARKLPVACRRAS